MHIRLKFESDEDEPEEIRHYNSDFELPMFSSTAVSYSVDKLARVLFNPNDSQVCHVQPMGVTRNASFIIDVDDVEFCDLKADDLGSWKSNGTKATSFQLSASGAVKILSSKDRRSGSYELTRRYYVHGTYNLFCRIIIDIKGMSFVTIRIFSLFHNVHMHVCLLPYG